MPEGVEEGDWEEGCVGGRLELWNRAQPQRPEGENPQQPTTKLDRCHSVREREGVEDHFVVDVVGNVEPIPQHEIGCHSQW